MNRLGESGVRNFTIGNFHDCHEVVNNHELKHHRLSHVTASSLV